MQTICGNTRTQTDAFRTEKPRNQKVILTNRRLHVDQVLLDQFTLCIFIYYIYIYIIYKSIYFFYIYRCTFPMIGYLTKRYSLDLVSIVQRYFFNLLFHLRSANSLRKNEIKLMFFPKSHILFAEEGRPVGPIDWCAMIEMTMHAMGPPWGQVAPGWSVVSRVTEKAAWHWDVHLPPPIYHHTTTRAQ